MLSLHLVFFFFQAEDGIRDYKVTGVQTCALPISQPRDLARLGICRSFQIPQLYGSLTVWENMMIGIGIVLANAGHGGFRSEERRVGKEGRSRWSPYH